MVKFINPSTIIAQAGIQPGYCVADLGCGSGFYTIAAASLVGKDGTVYAVDILQDKLAVTQSSAQHAGLSNVTIVHADLERPLEDIPATSCDLAVMSNIIHLVTNRDALFHNAYRLLKTGGRLVVVEWKRELTPFGPAMDIRMPKTELVPMLEKVGFRFEKDLEADGYHYAVSFIK